MLQRLFTPERQQYSIALNIQFFLLGILFFSVLSITLITYVTSKAEFEARNTTILEDKLRSILFEVEYKLGDYTAQNVLQEHVFLEKTLNKFSNIFYTDINLFSVSADLLASSASALYNQGIVSDKMHPVAYRELKAMRYPNVIQNETIGRMAYLSAYTPVSNKMGETIGYLNLPYFVKQRDFESQWGAFISSILNIYALLLVILLLTSIFIGNWLTSPLRKVREMLEGIDIDQVDQRLPYDAKNEIGDFVQVYNKKVGELREKSEELIETQKQMAWREMAKQVAHEIKNPLTPMKLSVQHLVRTLAVENPEEKKRLADFGNRMVEQIEVLAGIASEFSDFAQMPQAKMEQVQLSKLIADVLALNQSSVPESTEITSEIEDSILVMADRNQLIRVIQNLIKNAIQALPADRKGHIHVLVKQILEEKSVIVSVIDNGNGMPEEVKLKVFTPNFTTKSSGKGLGLAMCKKIIEAHQGRIFFDSREGETRFSFVLRLA